MATSDKTPVRDRLDSFSSSLLVIGVAGPSGSAKTTVCERIKAHRLLEGKRICIIACDSYYRTPPTGFDPDTYNFDTPDALELGLLGQHLRTLKSGGFVDIPVYSFVTHQRDPAAVTRVSGGDLDVILVEGIFALCDKRVRSTMDIKLYTQEDMDVCLIRRLRRDCQERGRNLKSVLGRYEDFVRPGFIKHIESSRRHADAIIPNAGVNNVALMMAVSLIASGAKRRDIHKPANHPPTPAGELQRALISLTPPSSPRTTPRSSPCRPQAPPLTQ